MQMSSVPEGIFSNPERVLECQTTRTDYYDEDFCFSLSLSLLLSKLFCFMLFHLNCSPGGARYVVVASRF